MKFVEVSLTAWGSEVTQLFRFTPTSCSENKFHSKNGLSRELITHLSSSGSSNPSIRSDQVRSIPRADRNKSARADPTVRSSLLLLETQTQQTAAGKKKRVKRSACAAFTDPREARNSERSAKTPLLRLLVDQTVKRSFPSAVRRFGHLLSNMPNGR